MKKNSICLAVAQHLLLILLFCCNVQLHFLLCSEAHQLTVKRLRFRPLPGRAGDKDKTSSNVIQLASCGLDHQVKVYNVYAS